LFIAVVVCAAICSAATSGPCGESVSFTIEGMVLTISGTGDMYDYERPENVPWSGEIVSTIVIEDGVTSIGSMAFYGCFLVNNVTVAPTVTIIKSSAFSYCSNLESITIPTGVISLENSVFSYCSSLTSVSLPTTLTSIGYFTFGYCESLKSITIPSLAVIGEWAFQYCSNLTSLTLPPTLTTIGNGAFSDCSNLASVIIPPGVTYIGNWAFRKCGNLTTISIPSAVTFIGEYAFSDCTSLSSPISLPSGLTSITEGVFSGCSNLMSVSIPGTVTSIASQAFAYCTNLESISIPASVTSIDMFVFQGCEKLKSITYAGVSDPCKGGLFGILDSLSDICVSLDYASSRLCGLEVNIDMSLFEHLRIHNNHCFGVIVCSDNVTSSISYRANATSWEDRSNGCVDYSCSNETGEVLTSKCTNKNEGICAGDACTSIKNLKGDGCAIEFEVLEGIRVADFNITYILTTLSEDGNVPADNLTLGMEMDADGYLLHLYVTVADEETAQTLQQSLNYCFDSDPSTVPEYSPCYVVVHFFKSMELKECGLSEGNQVAAVTSLILVSLVTALIAYF